MARNEELRQAVSELQRNVRSLRRALLCIIAGLVLVPALTISVMAVYFSLFGPASAAVVGVFWTALGTVVALIGLMLNR